MKEEILSIASDLREGHITSNEAKNLLLVLFGVVGRSEQLPCDCGVKLEETTLQVYCPKCWKTWKMKQGN